MTIVSILMLLGAFPVAPGQLTSPSENPCPSETVASRRIVSHFSVSPTHATTRSRHRLPSDSTQIRMLDDERDADACKRLTQFVHMRTNRSTSRWFPSFYRAGDFYYVVVERESRKEAAAPGMIRIDLGWTPMYVLDQDFNEVAALAM